MIGSVSLGPPDQPEPVLGSAIGRARGADRGMTIGGEGLAKHPRRIEPGSANCPGSPMIFEQIATGGCQSYLVGCEATCAAVLIDPELSQIDHYRGLCARHGLSVKYVIDTHTHADHFSASRELGKALGVPVVMHRLAPAPYPDLRLDDGG